MRRLALVLVVLAGSAGAEAAAPAPTAPPDERRSPLIGALVEGAFPDGVALAALVRPWRPLRLDLGLTYNLLGFGLRGGVEAVPIDGGVTPVVRAEVGHTFDADASGLASRFGNPTPLERELLRTVGYDYVGAQVGLELGAPDRLVFFVRGGLTWFWATAHGAQAALAAANPGLRVESRDPQAHGVVPALGLGVVWFVW